MRYLFVWDRFTCFDVWNLLVFQNVQSVLLAREHEQLRNEKLKSDAAVETLQERLRSQESMFEQRSRERAETQIVLSDTVKRLQSELKREKHEAASFKDRVELLEERLQRETELLEGNLTDLRQQLTTNDQVHEQRLKEVCIGCC